MFEGWQTRQSVLLKINFVTRYLTFSCKLNCGTFPECRRKRDCITKSLFLQIKHKYWIIWETICIKQERKEIWPGKNSIYQTLEYNTQFSTLRYRFLNRFIRSKFDAYYNISRRFISVDNKERKLSENTFHLSYQAGYEFFERKLIFGKSLSQCWALREGFISENAVIQVPTLFVALISRHAHPLVAQCTSEDYWILVTALPFIIFWCWTLLFEINLFLLGRVLRMF